MNEQTTAMVSYLKNLIWSPQISTFQINRGDKDSTERMHESASELEQESLWMDGEPEEVDSKREIVRRCLETVLIFLCFALVSGQLPPDVNESHYLTKAKHFWNPDWCAGDIFLGSSFAHWFFYVSTGWLTKLFSLSATAWIGRIITWALLAFAWQRFSWSLLPARGLAVFSAIFFLLLNERFHLAGEWVVGGFEAKGFAYFFVLMAIGSMIQRDWKWVWPFLGAAAAFHVLVGGWSMLSTLFACATIQWTAINDRRDDWYESLLASLKSFTLPFLVGAALCLVGLIPPLLADSAATPDESTAARLIYVNHRIAHHLTFDAFPTLHIARFVLISVLCFLLHCWIKSRWHAMYLRFRPLSYFCLASLLISFGGLLLSGLAEQNDELAAFCAGLLRFYWFRLSDFAVPATSAMACCLLIFMWMKSDKRFTTRISSLIFVSCIVAAGGLIVVEKNSDPRPRADRRSLPTYEGDSKKTADTFKNWKKVCGWIAANTPANATFITPHEQQTFKWYAGRSEVVCWKDIPQDTYGVIEWKSRLAELYDPQRRFEEGLLWYPDVRATTGTIADEVDGNSLPVMPIVRLAKHYQATHLLVPQRHVVAAKKRREAKKKAGERVPPKLNQVYPGPENPNEKSTYVVFEF